MSSKLSDTKPPRGVLRWLLRMPIYLYRLRMGRLLGNRFLMLTHIGRKSGQPRQSVLEVVGHHQATGSYIIASGWGEQADWLRNIQKNPNVLVDVRGRRFEATAERLSQEIATHEAREYAGRHPAAFRALAGRMIGRPLTGTAADYRALAEAVPFVALRPRAYVSGSKSDPS
jgi:deazaflavin-dependent oxidoreductase (nitroreductase family)